MLVLFPISYMRVLIHCTLTEGAFLAACTHQPTSGKINAKRETSAKHGGRPWGEIS